MYTSNRSRSFLLFEALIALLIVTLFITPVIKFPILYFKKQIEHLSGFEKRRIADWTYSEIKEMFLREAIPWHKLPKKEEKESPPFPLPETKLAVPTLNSRMISRNFILKCLREKEGLKGETYRLYEVIIVLDQEKISPSYRILVAHEPK